MTGQLQQTEAQRACACGCPLSMEGKKASARYATDACRAKHWKELTGYVKPRRENGENGKQRGRTKASGLQVSYHKALDAAIRAAVDARLAQGVPGTVLAARYMREALSDRQRARLEQRERAAA